MDAQNRASVSAGHRCGRIAAALHGGLALAVIGTSTLVLTATLCVLALGKALVPDGRSRQWVRSRLAAIAELWIGINNTVLPHGRRTRWDVQLPDGLNPKGCYLVLCNHRSWVDILVLQRCFNRRLPLLRFFLKKELFWVPFLGLAWWALDFPFMQRATSEQRTRPAGRRGRDLEAARRACEKFDRVPVAMMNFVEGTRWSQAKSEAAGSPYRHLLKPRLGGIGQVLYALGDRLDGCVDVTIAYPQCAAAPTFWHLVSGQIPQIIVRARLIDIPQHLRGRSFRDDPGFRRDLEAWVTALWTEKDQQIESLLPAV